MSKPNTSRPLSVLTIVGTALICTPLAMAQSAGDPKSKQSQEMMNKMDANKDAQVSKEEYMKYQEQRFDAADKDKSKTLSQQEWLRKQLDESDGNF